MDKMVLVRQHFLKLMLKILNPTEGKIYYNGTDIEKIGSNYYKEIGAVLEGKPQLVLVFVSETKFAIFRASDESSGK